MSIKKTKKQNKESDDELRRVRDSLKMSFFIFLSGYTWWYALWLHGKEIYLIWTKKKTKTERFLVLYSFKSLNNNNIKRKDLYELVKLFQIDTFHLLQKKCVKKIQNNWKSIETAMKEELFSTDYFKTVKIQSASNWYFSSLLRYLEKWTYSNNLWLIWRMCLLEYMWTRDDSPNQLALLLRIYAVTETSLGYSKQSMVSSKWYSLLGFWPRRCMWFNFYFLFLILFLSPSNTHTLKMNWPSSMFFFY